MEFLKVHQQHLLKMMYSQEVDAIQFKIVNISSIGVIINIMIANINVIRIKTFNLFLI